MIPDLPLGTTRCDDPPVASTPATRSTTTCAAPLTTATMADEHVLLSFEEARQLLRISRNTLYRIADAGQIPGARRVGKAWRFRRDLLLEWLSCSTPRVRTRRQSR